MLCKHEVTGSIPVSSTNILIRCIWLAAMAICGADPETGRPAFRGWFRQVSRASGLGFLTKKEEAAMFDNEIDWVTRLERWHVRREACELNDSERV